LAAKRQFRPVDTAGIFDAKRAVVRRIDVAVIVPPPRNTSASE
jgi:hypothetical protein